MADKEAQFKERFTKAKSDRQLWDSILDETYDLFLPNRNTQRTETKGSERQTLLYDSTGVESLQEWANNIKQSLLPSYQQWARAVPSGRVEAEVELGGATQEEAEELQRVLDVIIRVIFKYIWASNFDQAAHESIQDAGISTGALLLLDNDDVKDPLYFEAVPSNQVILDDNGRTVYREHQIKARQFPILFPKAKPDSNIATMIADEPEKKIHVIEGTVWNPIDKNWKYTVYVDKAARKFYYQEDYKVTPWIIFRTSVTPGEIMGRGAAINALPTMRVLNKLEEQLIYNNDMAIRPPLMMDTNLSLLDLSNVSISPQSILPVNYDYMGNNSAFKFLETSANFNVGENMKSGYQNKIRNMFALPMIGDVTDPTKSATEISIRNQQALSQQAAMFGRLQQELVAAVINRAHYILASYDIVPGEVDFNGEAISIKASSPLSRVQEAADMEGTLNYINMSMSLGEIGMAGMATTLNQEELWPFLADGMGVPAKLKLSEPERVKQQEKLMQAANMIQQGQQGAPQ